MRKKKTKSFTIFLWPLLRVGNQWIGLQKMEKKKSAKIKIKMPSTSSKIQAIVSKLIPQVRDGIWKNVEKSKKMTYFLFFCCKKSYFWVIFGHTQKGMPLRGAPLRGALGRAPLLFVERKYWKSFQEKVSWKLILYFFGKNVFFL